MTTFTTELTLADVIAQVQHFGGDPATTVFHTPLGEAMAYDTRYDRDRATGRMVVNLQTETADDWGDGDDDDD